MAKRGRERGVLGYEMWAQWCASGDVVSAGRSVLAKFMDNKGEFFFGGSGGRSDPADCLELQIEAAVVAMAALSPICADVLRLEYDAGWWGVAARRGIKSYDPRGIGQFEKASALGISLATYKRRLSEARSIIESKLGDQ